MILQVATQSIVPFFTNDVAGVVKALVIVTAPLAAGVAAIWKIAHGPQQRLLEDHSKRIADVELAQSKGWTETATLKGRVDRGELEMSVVRERLGELRSVVEQSVTQSNAHKQEILAEVRSLDKTIHGLSLLMEREREDKERRRTSRTRKPQDEP